MDEAKNLRNCVDELDWSSKPEYPVIKQRIVQLENISKPLLHLITLGCYWGSKPYEQIWANCFKLICDVKFPLTSYHDIWKDLFNYPALLIMYTLIMSCIKSGHYELLYTILNDIKSDKDHRYEKPVKISSLLFPEAVIIRDYCNKALYKENKKVPVSERVFDILREIIFQIVNNEDEYDILFDKAEYFYAVNYWYNETLDIKKGRTLEESWAPVGRFGYKFRHNSKVEIIFEQEFTQKDDWAAIKAGFFGSSFITFNKCSDAVISWISKLSLFF